MTMRSAVLLVLLAAAAAGCRDGSGRWSADERTQIEAFTTSVTKAQEAGPVTSTDLDKSAAALDAALEAAASVTDPVLRRIHPQLPQQYRTRFVPALRMRRAALEAQRAGQPTTARQLEWQIPMAA